MLGYNRNEATVDCGVDEVLRYESVRCASCNTVCCTVPFREDI